MFLIKKRRPADARYLLTLKLEVTVPNPELISEQLPFQPIEVLI